MSEPMAGLPFDAPDLISGVEQLKRELQAAVRGDPDAWRHPDVYDEDDMAENVERDLADHGIEPDEPANMVAPAPEIYKHAHAFMAAVFGEDNYTPDSIGQLIEAFLPCLRIMNDRKGHPWGPEGELWRDAGVLNLTGDVYKKHERFQYRLWTQGIMHLDSGYDLMNFIGFCVRSDPNSRFGVRGEPAPPRTES
jgi:hypothetical protein